MTMIVNKCDFCSKPAKFDGKTKMGPWAFMCEEHLEKYGYPDNSDLTKPLAQPAVPLAMKVCTVCGKQKPVTDFYEYRDRSDIKRYRGDCKECNLAAKKRHTNGMKY